jgi:hypothetical protein
MSIEIIFFIIAPILLIALLLARTSGLITTKNERILRDKKDANTRMLIERLKAYHSLNFEDFENMQTGSLTYLFDEASFHLEHKTGKRLGMRKFECDSFEGGQKLFRKRLVIILTRRGVIVKEQENV